MNTTQTFWDASQRTVRDDRIQTQYGEKVEPHFPRHATILDLGGGGGIDAVFFLRQGHSVIIADISKKGLEVALVRAQKEKLDDRLTQKRVTLGQEPLPLPDASVNIVYARLSLHYFTNKQTVAVLKEIHRVLAAGGSFFAIVKSPRDTQEMNHLKQNANEIAPSVFDDHGRIKSRFNLVTWREMLTRAGMTDADVHEYIEDFSGRHDAARSGASLLLCNEITFTKSS